MDRVLATIHIEWRLRTNIISFLIIWIGVIIFFLAFGNRPGSLEKWLSFIITCGFITVAYKIFVMFCLMIFAFITSTKKSGAIGEHQYKIKEDWLFHRTKVREILLKWRSIKSIWKDDLFIIVKIKRYLFLAIPKKDFSSSTQFNRFYQDLTDQWSEKKKIHNKTT